DDEYHLMNVIALEMFQEACGWPGRLDLDVLGPDGTPISRHQRDRPFARIGRDPRNDIRLDVANVSARHAYLQVIAGRPFGVDLGRRAGTGWRGESRSAGWLGPDDVLGVGDFTVRLAPGSAELLHASSVSSQEWNPLEAGSATRAGLPTFSLECASQGG